MTIKNIMKFLDWFCFDSKIIDGFTNFMGFGRTIYVYLI